MIVKHFLVNSGVVISHQPSFTWPCTWQLLYVLKGRIFHDVKGIKNVTTELNAVPLDTFDDCFA
jgi:hypothetical protein